MIFVVWLGLSFAVALLAQNRRLGFIAGFILSLLFSPLIGFLFAITSKSLEQEAREQKQLALQKEQTAALKAMQQQAQQAPTLADQIERLAQLRDAGHLTQEEFDAQKAKLLA